MFARLTSLALVVVFVGVLAGCTPAPTPPPATPPAQEQPPASEQPAAGLRLAPGLYELEDGTAQALGTLEYSDLEGGFWVLTGGTQAEGDQGKTVAVIANGADYESELKALEGKTVMVTGTKLDGASIRMAGPEIKITTIEEVSDTPGIAE